QKSAPVPEEPETEDEDTLHVTLLVSGFAFLDARGLLNYLFYRKHNEFARELAHSRKQTVIKVEGGVPMRQTGVLDFALLVWSYVFAAPFCNLTKGLVALSSYLLPCFTFCSTRFEIKNQFDPVFYLGFSDVILFVASILEYLPIIIFLLTKPRDAEDLFWCYAFVLGMYNICCVDEPWTWSSGPVEEETQDAISPSTTSWGSSLIPPATTFVIFMCVYFQIACYYRHNVPTDSTQAIKAAIEWIREHESGSWNEGQKWLDEDDSHDESQASNGKNDMHVLSRDGHRPKTIVVHLVGYGSGATLLATYALRESLSNLFLEDPSVSNTVILVEPMLDLEALADHSLSALLDTEAYFGVNLAMIASQRLRKNRIQVHQNHWIFQQTTEFFTTVRQFFTTVQREVDRHMPPSWFLSWLRKRGGQSRGNDGTEKASIFADIAKLLVQCIVATLDETIHACCVVEESCTKKLRMKTTGEKQKMKAAVTESDEHEDTWKT
ncbi:unnamed protein product, partial [Amoebophrya sp. A25]